MLHVNMVIIIRIIVEYNGTKITYALLQVLIKRHESDCPVTTCWHLSGCAHS